MCPIEIQKLFLQLLEEFKDYQVMYTDALKGPYSIFMGKAIAIKEALLLCQVGNRQKSVTDSMSAQSKTKCLYTQQYWKFYNLLGIIKGQRS
ncbi:unnamed protein product [Nezara viridula]|uniref:Uncharacterized protein n=1 Tax=Nezara viridula TaxID=85310 RepID=A0A9P0HL30_NEZVI|nr:unnamed protein product [Nezara viridula]